MKESTKNLLVETVKKIGAIIGAVSAVAALSFLFSWPIYMLWNHCLVGAIGSVQEVTWLQAWGISILSEMLVKTPFRRNN